MDPLDKTSLAEQATEAIKRQILTQHLQPGDRLPSERRLCEDLGISRTILREALSVLVAQGIIIKVPGKGIFVGEYDRCNLGVHIRLTITDRAELGALQDLRNMLEIGALELIARRGKPEELDRLGKMVEDMERRLSRGERVNEQDTLAHLALFGAAHVPSLMQFYEQVLRDVTDIAVFQNPQVRDVLTPETGMANLFLLKQVLSALRCGDVCGAQEAMKAHILFRG
jgi:GntR family transcriptional repressor for pyruvate dehydrogenase complex